VSNIFSTLELQALHLEPIPDSSLRELSMAQRARIYGLQAWAAGEDLEAVRYFQNSATHMARDTLEWAVSTRLYGLALIRVQKEVEGTFALERADGVLERFGVEPFSLEV
jgi:hypothetical protein